MAITWADVVLLDASFADVPAPNQADILATVDLLVAEGLWGDRWPLAQRYAAAHLARGLLDDLAAAAEPGSGHVGPVTSESVGPISVTYADYGATVPGTSSWFDIWKTTRWGRMYLGLVAVNPRFSIGFVV